MSVSNNLRKTRDNLKAFLKSNQVWQTNENLDALVSCATKSVISSFCVNWTFSPSKLQRGINGESGGWKMTNEWALYSSVCSLLPLTHLLCPSCLGVLISLQRAEINSSKKAGQWRKEISWQFRAISHGLQGGGKGLDLSERLRRRALWEFLLFTNPYLSFSVNATLFHMIRQSWIQNS